VRVIGECCNRCCGCPVSDRLGGQRHHSCAAAWLRFLRLRIGVFFDLLLAKWVVVLGLGSEGLRLRKLEFWTMCQ
jgi:hypothetical protein